MAIESITISGGGKSATITAERPPEPAMRYGDLVPGLIAARAAKISVSDLFPVPALVEFELPDQELGPDEDPAYRDFIDGRVVGLIASELIGQAGRPFGHLADARIEYRWKREGGRSGGADTIGKPLKLSGLLRDELDADFLIWLAADHCRSMRARQIEQAIFHLLCHFALSDDENPTIKIVRHDVEAFIPEIRLYGASSREFRAAHEAFTQQRLFPD